MSVQQDIDALIARSVEENEEVTIQRDFGHALQDELYRRCSTCSTVAKGQVLYIGYNREGLSWHIRVTDALPLNFWRTKVGH